MKGLSKKRFLAHLDPPADVYLPLFLEQPTFR